MVDPLGCIRFRSSPKGTGLYYRNVPVQAIVLEHHPNDVSAHSALSSRCCHHHAGTTQCVKRSNQSHSTGVVHVSRSNYRILGTFVRQLWLWGRSIQTAWMPNEIESRFLFPTMVAGIYWECSSDDFWDFLSNSSVHHHRVSVQENYIYDCNLRILVSSLHAYFSSSCINLNLHTICHSIMSLSVTLGKALPLPCHLQCGHHNWTHNVPSIRTFRNHYLFHN